MSLVQSAAAEIRNPSGTREFPPDISKTPFRVVATELAERAIQEFASGGASMPLAEWERLKRAIEWRFACALYEMAYPAPNRVDGSYVPDV